MSRCVFDRKLSNRSHQGWTRNPQTFVSIGLGLSNLTITLQTKACGFLFSVSVKEFLTPPPVQKPNLGFCRRLRISFTETENACQIAPLLLLGCVFERFSSHIRHYPPPKLPSSRSVDLAPLLLKLQNAFQSSHRRLKCGRQIDIITAVPYIMQHVRVSKSHC